MNSRDKRLVPKLCTMNTYGKGQWPTVSLKLSDSQRFRRTASTEDGGFSKSSKASMRMKSSTMSKKLMHATCKRGC